jgi:large subunit ribosomal protein L10
VLSNFLLLIEVRVVHGKRMSSNLAQGECAMSRRIKDMLIADITGRIGEARDMLVVDCSAMDAVTANRWRIGIAEANISALTVKNSMARNALARIGVDGLEEMLTGPSTLLWGGEDVVSVSKEISKWSKQVKGLRIKGATVEGRTLDAAGVDALSKSPGRLGLVAQIVGLMLSPAGQLTGALTGAGGRLAGVLKSIVDDEE